MWLAVSPGMRELQSNLEIRWIAMSLAMGLDGRQTEHLETGQRASVDQQLLGRATTVGAHRGRLSPDQLGAASPQPPPAFQTGIRGFPSSSLSHPSRGRMQNLLPTTKSIDIDRPAQWARRGGLDDRVERDRHAQILNSVLEFARRGHGAQRPIRQGEPPHRRSHS